MDESIEYRDIPGEIGYRMGSDMSVWSQRTTRGRLTGIWQRLVPIRLAGKKKYFYVKLTCSRTVLIHRLFLEVFRGPCPAGMECRHLDDDETNNSLSNLAWGTRSENMRDKYRNGGQTNVGAANPNARLTEFDVCDIRRRHASGRESYGQLAAAYGVSNALISQIVRRKVWSHVA